MIHVARDERNDDGNLPDSFGRTARRGLFSRFVIYNRNIGKKQRVHDDRSDFSYYFLVITVLCMFIPFVTLYGNPYNRSRHCSSESCLLFSSITKNELSPSFHRKCQCDAPEHPSSLPYIVLETGQNFKRAYQMMLQVCGLFSR